MTQGELVRQLGLASHTQITKLEANQNTTSPDVVLRIAILFGVTTDYLLRDSVPIEQDRSPEFTSISEGEITSNLFGEKLRGLRVHQGLSQRDLVHLLGLASRAYISNLEAGRKVPSLDLVVRIADLFGVTTDYLLSDKASVQISTCD